jgi:hypothetical protein
MKRLLLAIPLLFPLAAQAFDCWPRPVGTGTPFYVSQRDGMLAAVWWCDRVTHWRPQILAGTMPPAEAYRVAAQLSAAQDFDRAARALLAANARPLTEELRIFRIEAYWDHAQHKPADPVFTVAANAGRSTRPAYPVTDGVRSTRQDGTAAVGAPCQCSRLSFIEGRSVYCAFDQTPRVVVCNRQ